MSIRVWLKRDDLWLLSWKMRKQAKWDDMKRAGGTGCASEPDIPAKTVFAGEISSLPVSGRGGGDKKWASIIYADKGLREVTRHNILRGECWKGFVSSARNSSANQYDRIMLEVLVSVSRFAGKYYPPACPAHPSQNPSVSDTWKANYKSLF